MLTQQRNISFGHGAQWLRCDLHVHTPFDQEKKFGENTQLAIENFEKNNSHDLYKIAEKFVNACRNGADGKGLDLVAITDHNTIDGYRYLKPQFDSLSEASLNQGFHMPVILPGVEFSIGGERPIHFLVIFSSKTSVENIDNAILHVFGNKERFHPKTGIPLTNGESISTFIDRLFDYCRPESGERNLQFVLLPAHADSSRGVAKETGVRSQMTGGILDQMKGHLRQQAISRKDWDGFQTSRPFLELPEAFRNLLLQWDVARRGYDWNDLTSDDQKRYRHQKHWSLIECSDPKKYEYIGTRFSWLKMEIPDVEGIRLALLDPESRLRRMNDAPPTSDYPYIKRIIIRGTDFFEEITIPLSPCLTTLIGGRGSGKSTVVEYLRHVLDRDREVDLSDRYNHVFESVQSLLSMKSERDFGQSRGTLITDYQITVEIVLAGRIYCVTRSSKGIEITPHPEQYSSESVPLDVRTLIAPQILSQRQIAEIAHDPVSQRRELDSLMDNGLLRNFSESKKKCTEELRDYQSLRNSLIESKNNTPAVLTELQKIQDTIAFYEKEKHKQILTRFNEVERERRWLNDQLKDINNVKNFLIGLIESLEDLGEEKIELSPNHLNEFWFQSIGNQIRNTRDQVIKALYAQNKALETLSEKIRSEQLENWEPNYDQIRLEYDALIKEMGNKGVHLNNHEKLIQERVRLEYEKASLKNVGNELNRVEEKIRNVQIELQQIHLKRYKARMKLAQALEEVDADVRLQIHSFGDRSDFENRREQWFGGTGLQERDWLILCDYVYSTGSEIPYNLQKLVEALRIDIHSSISKGRSIDADDSQVASLVGYSALTKHFFNALVNIDHIRMDEMESFLPEDLVHAQVRGKDGTFKTIETGSVGEKSTAIISLLLSAGNQPIFIDQPEDDLDNQYVYNIIVGLLRRQKFKRQILIATHNANIPVNGDAELIVALGAENKIGTVMGAGSIDKSQIKKLVTTIMEGSAEAFRLRRKRYGF